MDWPQLINGTAAIAAFIGAQYAFVYLFPMRRFNWDDLAQFTMSVLLLWYGVVAAVRHVGDDRR